MADLDLTQAEADALLQLEKRKADSAVRDYPSSGGRVSIPLVSLNGREHFDLDLYRGGVRLAKGTYQNRARKVVILARLDFGGAPHRNPDDDEIPPPHLHLYREGYGDKWAFPLTEDRFTDAGDPWQSLQDFMRFCNIADPPDIRWGLL